MLCTDSLCSCAPIETSSIAFETSFIAFNAASEVELNSSEEIVTFPLIFEEEVITNTNGKYQKLVLTTEDPDFLNFMYQLKSILSTQESLSKNTISFAISELLDSFEIAILPKDKNPVKK